MEIGDRVLVKGKRGTVRFIGNIEGYPGDWVGIDYDDLNGGKHDGTFEGRRYFAARHPKSGSFVKRQLVDTGMDLINAIEDRYTDSSKINLDEVILANQKHIELVGMEKTAQKQSDIYGLTTIVLDNRNVSKSPPNNSPLFKRCKELNLYNNLLHKWSDIEGILSYFPVLEELVLRKNFMDKIEDHTTASPWKCSRKLENLILSDCAVDSNTISYALACISSVINLYVLRNEINRFEVPQAMAERLRILDLEGNNLNSINNIVGCYPNLVKCALVNVDLTESEKFPKLDHLNLLENEIYTWEAVQKLRNLPSLSTLFIKVKIFTVIHDITASEVITALLPNLKDLNRFDIKTTERRSAEIRFINKYSGQPKESKAIFEDDLKRLIEIWGPPVTDTLKKGVSIVKLKITNEVETMERSVPLEITIQRLSEMLCRLFMMNNLHTKIFLEKQQYFHRIELDNPARTLNHYSAESGDRLVLIAV